MKNSTKKLKLNDYILFVLILSCLAYSCNHKRKDNGTYNKMVGESERINIDPVNISEQTINASLVADNIQYIPLETPPNASIGSIDKLIVKNNRYYLFDRTTQSIFIFKTTGEYISKINSIGHGPGEYTDISSFTVDQTTNNIQIYNNRLRKIISYDSNGRYINERKFDQLLEDFISLDDKIYYIYLGYLPDYKSNDFPNQYRYLTVHEDTIVNKQLPYEYQDYYTTIPLTNHNFYSYGDSITLIEGIDNKIYRIQSNGNLKLRYTLDFGEYNSPSMSEMTKTQVDNYIANSKIQKWGEISYIIETPKNIFIAYSFNNIFQSSFYSKDSHRIYNCGPFWINDYANLPMPSPIANQDSTLYSAIDAFSFKSWFKHNKNKIPSKILELNNNINELDNPVIISFRIKEF